MPPMKVKPTRIRPEGWDLPMEVLATLPVEPKGVRLAAMATDFGFTTQAPIRQALKELRAQGYAIRIWAGNRRSGFRACIQGRSWGMAQVAASNYWERVYDSMDPERQVAAVAAG